MLEITIIFDWISSGVAVPKDIKKSWTHSIFLRCSTTRTIQSKAHDYSQAFTALHGLYFEIMELSRISVQRKRIFMSFCYCYPIVIQLFYVNTPFICHLQI